MSRAPARAPRSGGKVQRARLIAYDVLRDVVDRDAYANLALAAHLRGAGLSARDAALATELSAGTLRNLGRIDRILELAAGRSVEKIDSRTLNVLRLGAHQLLHMRTAGHAAIYESVELQRIVGNRSASGFVNGVLRTVQRSSAECWDEQITAAAATAEMALAQRTSHPAWVLRALRDALRAEGREDELVQLLEANNSAPKVSMALLPGAAISAAELARELPEVFSASGLSACALELTRGDPARAMQAAGTIAALPAGYLRVQDQGSQLAALALLNCREIVPGEKWLDLCAGPGGKTALLAAAALARGASVRANEVNQTRCELVQNATLPVLEAGGRISYANHDGRTEQAYGCSGGTHQLYDRILVDAPCSGLGALRRRPEARWRKQPGDLPQLTSLQYDLLNAALPHLAPGGVLAYVTCSPHLAETRLVINRLLKNHPQLRELDAKQAVRVSARADAGGADAGAGSAGAGSAGGGSAGGAGAGAGSAGAAGAGGADAVDLPGTHASAQLWPHRHGTDAMFIALLSTQ